MRKKPIENKKKNIQTGSRRAELISDVTTGQSSIMADRKQHDFSEDGLSCSSSSFKKNSGESTWEDGGNRLEVRFHRPDVRPYQFEPARELDKDDGDDGSNSDPDPQMRDDW